MAGSGDNGRFPDFLAFTSTLLCVIAPDGTFRRVNPAWQTVLGYAPEELLERRALDVVHPDDTALVAALFECGDGERPGARHQEIRLLCKDGTSRWFAWDMAESEQDRALYCVAHDITGHKQHEETLLRNEEEYRKLYNAAQRQARELSLLSQTRASLARELEISGVIRTVVEAIADTFGYTHVSLYLIQDGILHLQHQVGYDTVIEQIPLTRGVMGRVVRTGHPVLLKQVETDPDFLGAVNGIVSEICVPLHDRHEVVGAFNVETVNGMALGEDDLHLMTALAEHVSIAIERARLYTTLRESEVRFRGLIEHSSDGILLLEPTGTVRYVSPSTQRILGYDDERLLGDELSSLLHPDDVEPFRRFLATLHDNPAMTRVAEYRLLKESGEYCWIEMVGHSTTDVPQLQGIIVNYRDVTERKRGAEALRQQNEYLAALHETSLGLMNRLDLSDLLETIVARAGQLMGTSHGYIYLLDPADDSMTMRVGTGLFAEHIGYRVERGQGIGGLVHAEGRPVALTDYSQWERRMDDAQWDAARAVIALPLRSGTRVVGVMGLAHDREDRIFGEGEIALLSRFAQLASLALDNAHLYSSMQQELAERERAEAALRVSEERYKLAAEAANDGLWDWDLTSNRIYYSPRWKNMVGAGEEDIGDSPAEWLNRVHPKDLAELNAQIEAHLAGEAPQLEAIYRIRHSDGGYRCMLCRGLAVRDDTGAPYRMAGSQTDITERKRAEKQLLYDALHDSLTGLPNRTLFTERLARAIQRARQHEDYRFAVLFLDLDRFKLVNDSLGHLAGDELLIMIAQRLSGALRPIDTVARLGGDEFTILVEDILHIEDAMRVAERVQAALSDSFHLHNQELFISASIGIVPDDPLVNRPEEFLRNADIAMYRAKASGKARYEVFNSDMHERAVALLKLETSLRHAIEREEFLLHYQPIVSLRSGRITGVEALLRWQHPDQGLVLPGSFIEIAEETGLIVPIGTWVLRAACRQMREWLDQLGESGPLTINVNLSGKQLTRPDLVEQIAAVLDETRLPSSSLKLEITESTIMDNAEAAASTLAELRSLGVYLQLDDFGTGYSSLGYLHRFPIDTLKIDRSFTSHLVSGGENVSIVHTVVALAHSLRMDVVAEGVETAEQMHRLRALHCEFGQGYYFSEALTAEDTLALLRRGIICEVPQGRHTSGTRRAG